MTSKAKRARYTLEFKLEAVRLVKAGQSMAAVGATLGVADQTLYNWVKADRECRLTGADAKPVSVEQMELARLRAEVARLKMERDILKNVWSAPILQAVFADVRRTFCVNVSGQLGTLVPGLDGIRARLASQSVQSRRTAFLARLKVRRSTVLSSTIAARKNKTV